MSLAPPLVVVTGVEAVLALSTVVGVGVVTTAAPLFAHVPVVETAAAIELEGLPDPVFVAVTAGAEPAQEVTAAPLFAQVDGWVTTGPLAAVEATGPSVVFGKVAVVALVMVVVAAPGPATSVSLVTTSLVVTTVCVRGVATTVVLRSRRV